MKSRRHSRWIGLAFVAMAAAAAIFISACGGSSTTPSSTPSSTSPGKDNSAHSASYSAKAHALLPAAVRSAGEIKVASSIGFPPYEFFAKNNKTFLGLDIDLMHAMSKVLGVNLAVQNVSYPNIIPSIQAGREQIGWSAYQVDPQAKGVIFVPYYNDPAGLLVKPGSDVKSHDPLSMCGKSIGEVQGEAPITSILNATNKLCKAAGKPPMTVKNYENSTTALLAIQSGQLDARGTGLANGKYSAKLAGGSFQFVPAVLPKDPPTINAIVVPTAQKDLVPALQAGLRAMIKNGSYMAVLHKWGVTTGAVQHVIAIKP
jgi:polar amino acid transport system substrate-binding protein